jgi:septal ring factor EnvC (AmiA/AmiB activator)
MKHKIAFGVVMILALAVLVSAQLKPYPDVLTSQTAAAQALMSYKDTLESNIAAVSAAQQSDAAAIAKLTDQSAAVATLQQQLQQLQQQLAADEARIKALEDKVKAAGSTLAAP